MKTEMRKLSSEIAFFFPGLPMMVSTGAVQSGGTSSGIECGAFDVCNHFSFSGSAC
ncbi:MAG: hypothetical protein V8T29_05195 [Oscillospiraceae bacterium]